MRGSLLTKNNSDSKCAFSNIWPILCILIFEIWTFRKVLFEGLMVGSDRDGLLAILMNEHWLNVLLGKEKWNTWICMFPVENSVAFNDMYLLHAIFFCPLRLLGIDKYIAMTTVQIIIHTLGSILMYVFLYRFLEYKKIAALIGCAEFSYGSYYLIKIWHTQFLCLSLIPILIISFYEFWVNIDREVSRRFGYELAIVLTEVLLFYTSPYMAEFVLITLFIYVVIALIIMDDRRDLIVKVMNFLKNNFFEILMLSVIGIVLMIPFMKVYFPTMGNNTRSFEDAMNYMIPWYGIFNVSSTNVVYGKVMAALPFMQDGEITAGLPLMEWVLLVCAFFLSIRRKNKRIITVFVTIVTIFLIAVRFGNFSFWIIFYRFFPGVSGMRVVCRLALMALPLAGIIIAWFINLLCNSDLYMNSQLCKMGIILLMLFAVLENSQRDGILSAWNYNDSMSREASLDVAPPQGCKSFYVIDSSAEEYQAEYPYFYRGCVDAWLLADMYNIPTLNGFASYLPDGYGTVYNIYTENYEDEIERWVTEKGLDSVYRYDFATKEWELAY